MLNDCRAMAVKHLQHVRKATRPFSTISSCKTRLHCDRIAMLQCEKEAVIAFSRKNPDMRYPGTELYEP